MAKWITVAILVLVGLAPSQTPTKPTQISDSAVAAPTTTTVSVWVVSPAGKILVQPDASIKINLATTPPTISAVLPSILVPLEKVDQFTAAAGQTAFSMSSAPVGAVKVFKNGVLQMSAADYTLSGQLVTFLPAQGVALGDYVQITYASYGK